MLGELKGGLADLDREARAAPRGRVRAGAEPRDASAHRRAPGRRQSESLRAELRKARLTGIQVRLPVESFGGKLANLPDGGGEVANQ